MDRKDLDFLAFISASAIIIIILLLLYPLVVH